jgi:peroxiredoxin
MTFQAELDSFRAAWEARVGDAVATLVAGDIEDLRGSGILDRTARAGDAFPTGTTLLDAAGRLFDLGALVARGPVVVTFYRGGWCPYCNLELRAYMARLAEIRAAGAELVAVSFERPDHLRDTAMKNDLAYPVLTDVDGALASALGIRFTLSEAVRPFYEKAGHALPERNGDGAWALPLPATFVVAREGRIRAAFVEPDYRKRTDPRAALDALLPVAA